MTFNDPGEIPGSEDDPANSQIGIFVKAEFDCLVIRGRDAVMSGVITESNVGAVLGYRVLLVVEDNGEGVNAPDQYLNLGILFSLIMSSRDTGSEGQRNWSHSTRHQHHYYASGWHDPDKWQNG